MRSTAARRDPSPTPSASLPLASVPAPRPSLPRSARLRTTRPVLATVLIVLSAGCTSPPSVAPLLRLAHEAIREEARLVEADAERDRLATEATMRSLDAGYDADLRERESLSAEWVAEATRAYVLAREAVLRHEAEQAQTRARRADNLAAAAEATERAAALLERRDALIAEAVRVDARRLLRLGLTKGEGR